MTPTIPKPSTTSNPQPGPASRPRLSKQHLCHAVACPTPVPEEKLMCPLHWAIVPKRLQKQIWATYVSGQETRKTPSKAYLIASGEAISLVARKEDRCATCSDPDCEHSPIEKDWSFGARIKQREAVRRTQTVLF